MSYIYERESLYFPLTFLTRELPSSLSLTEAYTTYIAQSYFLSHMMLGALYYHTRCLRHLGAEEET